MMQWNALNRNAEGPVFTVPTRWPHCVWCSGVCLLLITQWSCSAGFASAPRPHSKVVEEKLNSAARSRDILTADELKMHPELSNASLFAAIQSLRPEYLSTPVAQAGRIVFARTAVILDANHVGDVDALIGISASQVSEVRYVRSSEAQLHYGEQYRGGVIVVLMKK